MEPQAPQEQPTPTNEPTNVAPIEQPVEPQAQVPAPMQETPDAPAPSQEAPEEVLPPQPEEQEEVDIPTFQMAQQGVQQVQQQYPQQPLQAPQLDPKDFTDQYGNVDVGKFGQALTVRDQALAQAITQQVIQNVLPQAAQITAAQVTAAKQEERAWDTVFKKYPQVKDNKELRDLVHQTRLGSYRAQDNSINTPLKAADKLFKYVRAAKDEGAKQATQSVRTQASAHLETSDNTASERGLKQQTNMSNIDNRDRKVAEQARIGVLKQWMADNKL